MVRPMRTLLVLWFVSSALSVWAQRLNFENKEDFLQIVDPIITRGERAIYEKLPDSEARKYFQAIFWYKRDPKPYTTFNDFRNSFFERRQIANIQLGEGALAGSKTERGRILLLLGDPDDVQQKRLPHSGLKAGYEELWTYGTLGLTLGFVLDGSGTNYRLREKQRIAERLEKIRNAQVLDRAEPYTMKRLPLSLPNLGFTKDVENLAADDRNDIDFELTYSFFQGNLNRTEILLGLTFRDASTRGLIVHLVVYDPYQSKILDVKKRLDPENGRFESFPIALEPDQYHMVLRLTDKDGRESINRQIIDVPRLGVSGPSASSLLASSGLVEVPLQGFFLPKKFVFSDVFFPISNDFTSFRGDRLYLMQHFYLFDYVPELRFFLNRREIAGRVERSIQEGTLLRMVYSIPLSDVGEGLHRVRSVYADLSGNLVSSGLRLRLGAGTHPAADLLGEADSSERFQWILPSSPDAARLERVVVRPDRDLRVDRMYVFLNGRLLLERDKAPWDVSVRPGLFSISGENRLTVVLDTDRGLLKQEKILNPLRADEKINSRLVQIYFNAFDENLEFVSDLPLNDLSVKVDGVSFEPKEVEKLDEPITYCFLVDTSYSMRDSFNGNIDAVKKFIESMRPQDRGYFVSFSNKYEQHLLPTQSKAVLLAVAGSLKLQQPNPKHGDKLYVENETYLYDAVIAAIHTLIQSPDRKIMIMVSDGIGIEGEYARNGMLAYSREKDVVLYSLWLDNNPTLSDEDRAFLRVEKSKGERFARAIGLTRFFAKKDAKVNHMANKIRKSAINEGALKILSEESGGYHYRIFRTDRKLIADFVHDIERAVASQYMLTLNLPLAEKSQHVEISCSDPNINFRCKSIIDVRQSNPLAE